MSLHNYLYKQALITEAITGSYEASKEPNPDLKRIAALKGSIWGAGLSGGALAGLLTGAALAPKSPLTILGSGTLGGLLGYGVGLPVSNWVYEELSKTEKKASRSYEKW